MPKSKRNNILEVSIMGTLSKIDILKPLYACGGGIYLSQIFSGAKVVVTAQKQSGTTVILFDDIVETSDGNAWLFLSQPLEVGSTVTAIQELNGDKSPVSDLVIVNPIPYNSKEKIDTPVVIPPLYTCGTVIPFDEIVNGATVDIIITGIKKATLPMPGPRVDLLWSPLQQGDEISAKQRLCKVESNVSPKIAVINYPKRRLPKPIITEPVFDCATAILISNLITGSLVTVYLDGDFANPYTEASATGNSTVIPIKPLKAGTEITVDQRFCKVISLKAKPITVEKSTGLPAPDIISVTPDTVNVNGILSAELRIINVSTGEQIGSRTCAGSGTVVNISPPINLGEKVIAVQFFYDCSKESPPSAEVPYECSPIVFDPAKWNEKNHIGCNNCYNYACDILTDTFAQPGQGGNPPISNLKDECKDITKGALNDGLTICKETCSGCSHKVALVIAPGYDFHWYRQDANGLWSHKPGCTPARNLDDSDKIITNPETCNRGPYTDFCGYFCVNKDKVKLKGAGCRCL